jgi:hypothetical protein
MSAAQPLHSLDAIRGAYPSDGGALMVELSSAQLAQLADLVAARLRAERPAELLSAAELARRLAVHVRYVYAHATELGAIRLGDGPNARLRFDPQEAVARYASKRPQPENASDDGGSAAPRRRRGGRVPIGLPEPGRVLKVRA